MASERVQYPEIQNVEFSSVADADKCRRIAQAYKKATIEQCAQIADKAQAKSEEEVREFRRLKLSGCAMQSQSEMSAFRTVAAAIRSMAQEGE